MKRQIVFLFMLLTIIISCASIEKMLTIIPQNTLDEIPLQACKAISANTQTMIENFNYSYKYLLENDYRIEADNKEMGYILASKMDVGDTYVRLNIVCTDNQISTTSEWKPGANSVAFASGLSGINMTADWNKAIWTKQYDKPNIAFAKAVQFAKGVSNSVTYK